MKAGNGNIIVDTSAIISLFRGRQQAQEQFNLAQEVWLPVVVLGELYCGLRKCNNPQKERLRINDFRDRSLVVGVDEGTATRYAEIHCALESKGKMIPINDIWIAAFALHHELPLLASDRHFESIEDLSFIYLR